MDISCLSFAEAVKACNINPHQIDSLAQKISGMEAKEVAEARDTIRLMVVLEEFVEENMYILNQIIEALIKRAKEIWP